MGQALRSLPCKMTHPGFPQSPDNSGPVSQASTANPTLMSPFCAQYRSEVSTTQSLGRPESAALPQGHRNTAEGLQPRRPEGLLLYLVHMCRLRAIVRPGGNTAPVTQAPAAMQLDAFNAAGTERTARWEGGGWSEEIKTAETPQIVSPGCGAGF